MDFMYEDDLPADITDAEYDAWFALSWVDGVRLGPVFVRSETDENRACKVSQ